MRSSTLMLVMGTVGLVGNGRRPLPEQETVVVGVVRTAVSGEPIPNASVYTNLASDPVRTDSTGRFVLRTSRGATFMAVGKVGFLAFEYPILQLTTDSLFAEIELRTDPPVASYVNGHFLPFLCVLRDAPDRIKVSNTCGALPHPLSEYKRQIIKHNPWSLYFGPAGDRGGVMLYTRGVTS